MKSFRNLLLLLCAFCAFLRPIILAQEAPANVQAYPTLGGLTRPTATQFFGNTTNSAAIATALGSTYQPLSSNLTSWAAITRASGFDTFTASPSSANLRNLVTDESGTGALIFAGGNLGAATATSINGNTFTTGTYTLTGTAGKTLNFTNSITLTGTDAQTYTFPSTSATPARTDAANTFTGTQTIGVVAGSNGQTITGNSSGAWAIAANGTNQNVTLTPSGTGVGLVGSTFTNNFGTSGSVLAVQGSAGANLYLQGNSGQDFKLTADGGNGAFFDIGGAATSTNNRFVIRAASGNASYSLGTIFRLESNGHLLLGGLTTDGTGVLQFPAATTSAGGITFGADSFIYRTGAGYWNVEGSGATGTGITIKRTGGTASSWDLYTPSGGTTFVLGYSAAGAVITLDSGQNVTLAKKITSYNGVATAGWGVPAIQGATEVTAQSAANSSIATYTVGAADGTFEVSAQVDVTAATVLSTTITCTYTDKSNTSRVMIFPVQQLTGSFIAGGLITGTGAWETPVMHIRCKASTAITIGTTAGTFTGVTYSADATIVQKN